MFTITQSRSVAVIFRFAVAWVAAAGLTACSSFNSEWSRLTALEATPAPMASSGVEGRWEGVWRSGSSDHEGALRCIVKPAALPPSSAANMGAYVFSFSATWGPGIVSDYDIEMVTEQQEDRVTFKGEMNLGFLFGSYQCDGYIKGEQFSATYEAMGDKGVFEMTRPKK